MKMKAACMSVFGGPEVLRIEQLDVPMLKPGYVLIRVLAAGVNYYDTLVRMGSVTREMPLPHVPGSDVIGTVVQVADDVTRFQAGDPVIVAPGFPVKMDEWHGEPENYQPSYYPGGTFNCGGYAQFMLMHERWLLRNDLDLSPVDAACLPLVLVTAIHSVKYQGEVSAGKRVLVHAGASGSGSMAIQVARALGASVMTTVSTQAKADLARRFGANEVVLYQTENFADAALEWTQGDGVDTVIDPVGGDTVADSLRALRWGGILVNYGLVGGAEAKIPHLFPFFRSQCQIRGSFMGTLDELREGLDLVRAGKVRPVLDEAFALERVAEVHERLQNHSVAGKFVLLPWD